MELKPPMVSSGDDDGSENALPDERVTQQHADASADTDAAAGEVSLPPALAVDSPSTSGALAVRLPHTSTASPMRLVATANAANSSGAPKQQVFFIKTVRRPMSIHSHV